MFKRAVPALLMVGMAASANALEIQNGSFESGDFSGWVASPIDGTTTVADSQSGFAATDGSYFANLRADAVLQSGAQTWLAGEQLSFDWNFLAGEDIVEWETDHNDYSVFVVLDINGNTVDSVDLADILGLFPSGDESTGWGSYTYTFADAGAGSFAFGVFNVGTNRGDSRLLIDNVDALGGGTPPPTSVPEPATLALLAMGLAGLGFSRRLAAR